METNGTIFDQTKRILIIGDLMLDGYASGDVQRISPEAPVPVLRHISQHEVAGGGANVAVNIAALGGKPILIGLTGADDEATRLEAILTASGVEAELVRDPRRPTTHKVRVLAGKHQMLRIDKEDVVPADGMIEAQLVQAAERYIDGVAAVILSDYLKGCLTDRVIRDICDMARRRGVPVLVDPKRPDFSVYRGASYVTPNRSELRHATGIECHDEETSRKAAKMAVEASGAAVLLTRSERGMALFLTDGEEIWLPTQAREVYDVSGAGDSVIAAFTYALASGLPVSQALRIANVAAGIVIGKVGTATASEAEVVRAMEQEHFQPISKKITVTIEEAMQIRAMWRREGLSVGFTNGCFDLLHSGHVSLLREASQHCDRLIVALNSDASVKRLKGPSRPVQEESGRADVMASIRFVDLVVIFEEDTPFEVIQQLVPDVLIKGADYSEDAIVGGDIVKAAGGRIVRAELIPGRSTTNLIKKSVVG